MKKFILILGFILLLPLTGGLFAQEMDYQLGLGYSGFYYGGNDTVIGAYPLGIAFMAGLGYCITPDISAGFEYEISRGWSFEDTRDENVHSLTEHIPKAYFRFYSDSSLALSILAGTDIQIPEFGNEKGESSSAFTMGLRLTGSKLYFQYMTVFQEGRVDHRLGFGIKFGNKISF